ncbi:MAG: helix-turn-helix transcriptional regulator [Oscillospiraceae bacterium]|nr:helix-turn-helix transcriptional regulator [Oscillospiraceae bacterium]
MNDFDQFCIEVGLRVAYYRKKNNYTQEELAEKIGLSAGYLSQVETPTCVQPISLKTLFLISRVFDIPPSVLLSGL